MTQDEIKKATKILENILLISKTTKTKDKINLPQKIRDDVDVIIKKIDKNKSIASALATSLVKKIIYPKQDIRLHRTDFDGGYSARTLDTYVTTPFFKNHFTRYANKETSFLTLATREKIKWTRKEGKNLKIRDIELKNSFLEILDLVQTNIIKPKNVLIYLLRKLSMISLEQVKVLGETLDKANYLSILNINTILKC